MIYRKKLLNVTSKFLNVNNVGAEINSLEAHLLAIRTSSIAHYESNEWQIISEKSGSRPEI